MLSKAVILAGGLGARMQKPDPTAPLDEQAEAMAGSGHKWMVPVEGRSFVEYSLRELEDAGLTDVCLVVGPKSSRIREYLQEEADLPDSIRISFAVQPEPLGTANALLPAQEFTGADEFVTLNADNVYPSHSLRLLAEHKPAGWALLGFELHTLVQKSNIEEDRIRHFAVLDVDRAHRLRRIVENAPDPDRFQRNGHLFVSMNCFRFDSRIYKACEAVEPDPIRGEFQLPDAVEYAIEHWGVQPLVIPTRAGVVDLTYRRSVPSAVKLIREGSYR